MARAPESDRTIRSMRVGIVLIVLLALSGCGSAERSKLVFRYDARGGDGNIDQNLTIENDGPAGVAPHLEFTPLDASGEAIDGITVSTAFGSDRGRRVVPGGTALFDVLRFEGARKRDVENVRVRVAEEPRVSVKPGLREPLVQRIDAHGRVVAYGEYFESLRVPNPNDAAIRVRVVLLEYEDPPPGKPQQVVRVTPLSSLIDIPAKGARTIRAPGDTGRRPGSVKVFLSR